MRVLFVSPEIYPMAKTGGLGDVSAALPAALAAEGVDVRLVMPAYPTAREAVLQAKPVRPLGDFGALGSAGVIEAMTPDSALPVWLIDSPDLYDRGGGPYHDDAGREWPDNFERFALLSRAAARLSSSASPFDWSPDVVHANDWQTGLVVPLLLPQPWRPRLVFTIHNLAFQGIFPSERYALTGLPQELLGVAGIGHGEGFSLLKAGVELADWVTTVSPTYAYEIQTPQFGAGFETILAARSDSLSGILNGVDYRVWNPARDPHIAQPYDADDLSGKAACKAALTTAFGLAAAPHAPLFGIVSRLTEQKGLDLVPAALEPALEAGGRLVVLGRGDAGIEQQLRDLAARRPDAVAVRTAFDEPLAHAVEAGADIFLMPSRFEPSGLNQMYSMRYGTPPVVHKVGGLADTVVDADVASLHDESATGFVFDAPTALAFEQAIVRALSLFSDADRWRSLQRTGMRTDFSWTRSAHAYLDLYNAL
jgi:starch synthase